MSVCGLRHMGWTLRGYERIIQVRFAERLLLYTECMHCGGNRANLLINLKVTFLEPAVGSRRNFARMCG